MTESLYRPHILDHARNPRNRGVVGAATHGAERANPRCGDRCHVTARVVDSVLEMVRFDGDGCALSTAAASLLSEDAEGKRLGDMIVLTDDAFLELLGVSVTSGRIDCVLLPFTTLKNLRLL